MLGKIAHTCNAKKKTKAGFEATSLRCDSFWPRNQTSVLFGTEGEHTQSILKVLNLLYKASKSHNVIFFGT